MQEREAEKRIIKVLEIKNRFDLSQNLSVVPKMKTAYQKRIDEAKNDLELDSLLLNFMKIYLTIYLDIKNEEYLELSKWVARKRLEIIPKEKLFNYQNL